ncbi:MAG: HD domain-containing protein [Anaerolineae bacterium]
MFERRLTRKEIELIKEIEAFIKDKHSQAQGHDYSHVLQVTRYAIQIAEAIPDEVNPFILICAALFHDIGRIGTITGVLHGLRGATIADEYLESTWVGADVRKKISRIVTRHTPTSMIPPMSIEEKIIYDADALDRLGLMGMLRGIVGKSGSIEDILTDRIQKREGDYDKLYFEESQRIGEQLQAETIEVIQRFRKALDKRAEQIAHIEWPVERIAISSEEKE